MGVKSDCRDDNPNCYDNTNFDRTFRTHFLHSFTAIKKSKLSATVPQWPRPFQNPAIYATLDQQSLLSPLA